MIKKTKHKYMLLLLINHPMSSSQFPMGAGSDGPLGGMAGMEPHHMNGSLGTVCDYVCR